MRALRVLLAARELRLLLGAQFVAQFADGFAQAAFAERLVLEPFEQGTPGRILALFLFTLVPYSLIAPFLGVFVDRWPRRGLLVWTNVVRGLLLTSLPLWGRALGGDAALFAGVLLLLGLGRLFLTTKGALLPVLLGERHLVAGNSLSGGGGMISALIGGVAGIVGVGLAGPQAAFALAGLTYLGGALLAGRLKTPYGHARPAERGLFFAAAERARELVAGVSEVARRPPARLALVAIFLLRTAAMFSAIAAILVIKAEFPAAGDRFGRLSAAALALGAAGAGALLGALAAPLLGRRLAKPGLILTGFVVAGAGIVVLGGVEAIPAVLGLTALGGFGGFVSKVAVDATLQESLPDLFRGRAFALYDIVYNLASVAAGAVMVAFEEVALRPLLVSAGVATLAIAAALGTEMRRQGLAAVRVAGADA
jgi:MFS family permease